MKEVVTTAKGLKVVIELTPDGVERKRLVALKKELEDRLFAIRKSIQEIDNKVYNLNKK